MNYKEKMLTYLTEGKKDAIEEYEDMEKSSEAIEKAHDLTHAFLTLRFKNELRQYNNNEEKAYDEFIARKNLDYLRIYIEEILLLEKTEKEILTLKPVQKEMRNILNCLYALVNGVFDGEDF